MLDASLARGTSEPGMKAPQRTEGTLAATAANRNCQSHLHYFFFVMETAMDH